MSDDDTPYGDAEEVELILENDSEIELITEDIDLVGEPNTQWRTDRHSVGWGQTEYEGSFSFEVDDIDAVKLALWTPNPEHSWFSDRYGTDTSDDSVGLYDNGGTSVEEYHEHFEIDDDAAEHINEIEERLYEELWKQWEALEQMYARAALAYIGLAKG